MIEGKRRAILLRAKGQVIFYMINLISIFNGLQITDQRDAMIFTPEGILHGYILILFRLQKGGLIEFLFFEDFKLIP